MSSGGNWTAGVMARQDILDRPERLRGAFWVSVAMHVGVAGALIGATWVQSHGQRAVFGDLNGGGIGSVAVNVVARIPIPAQSGAVNPVANDTESRAPEAPSKTKPQARVKEPDLEAIPLPSRNALKKTGESASAPNKFRDQQPQLPNQVYSQSGGRMVDNMYGMSGGGGVRAGTSSPFGTQFGWYSDLIKGRVGQNWRTGEINPRIRTANATVVTFTIQRDGSVSYSSVRITQSSGIPELDNSAKRAVVESAPFDKLPAGFNRNSADVELWFELRR
jgi:periplasmic protein TonB